MVRMKFCGMTNLDDCLAAADLSVDLVGFVFYNRSPRYIMPGRVRRIAERLDGRVKKVGVFVQEDDGEIAQIMEYCGLDLAQVYRESQLPNTICAYRIRDRLPAALSTGLLLFDRYSEGFGGSGRSFDFSLLDSCTEVNRAFIAGGLNERNVESVLRFTPLGVDVASGVEAYPGKKDYRKMARFAEKVRGYMI
jgi:phosphoribosylanthranilate isomerase